MGIILSLVIGGVAGWLAGIIMKGGGFGIVGNIIVGIVGGVLGGYLFDVIGIGGDEGSLVGSPAYTAHEFIPTRDPMQGLTQAVKLCDV